MSKYEVTRGEYRVVIGTDPSPWPGSTNCPGGTVLDPQGPALPAPRWPYPPSRAARGSCYGRHDRAADCRSAIRSGWPDSGSSRSQGSFGEGQRRAKVLPDL